MSRILHTPLSRRQALAGLAGATGVALAGPALAGAPRVTLVSDAACVLTPQAAEGPFYFDPALVRADIREDRPGVPLDLRLQVVAAGNCSPLAGARVDVWQCDATGHYSGYGGQGDGRSSTAGQSFLRGTQFADAGGVAGFRTIYPGWYRGRTTHIHFKVFLDGDTLVTGQLYFPDEVSDGLYAAAAPYNQRSAARDTWNANDGVLARSGAGAESIADVAAVSSGYEAALVIGVAA